MSLVFRQAIRCGKLTDNPARRVPHKAERNERVRFLSPAEEKKLSKVILERYPERVAEFELALHTGLRLSEQYQARWDSVNWDQRVLTIPQDKGGRTSHVPLNDIAFEALRQLRHRTLAMVMRYAHLAPDFGMDAVQRMQKKFALKKRRAKGAKSGTTDFKEQTSVH